MGIEEVVLLSEGSFFIGYLENFSSHEVVEGDLDVGGASGEDGYACDG